MANQINRSIIIDAKVKTTLEGMNEVVSKLNQGLREGTAKLDLTKGVGSSLSKQMDKFKDEYSKFSKYIEGGKIEFADSKDAIKSGETLIKTFKEMRRVVGDFDDLTVIDAKKLFPDAFDSRVSDLLKGLNGLSSVMTKLESKQLDLATARTEMGELSREAQRLQGLIDQEISLKLELDQAESDLKHFDSEIEAIRTKAAKGITLKINTAEAAHGEAKKGIEEIETARKARGFSQEDFSGTTARAVKFKGKTEKQWTDQSTKKDASEASKAEATAALQAIRIYRQEENVLKDLNATLQAKKKEIDSLRESLSNINNMKVSQAVKVAGGTAEEINEANEAMQVHAEATTEAAAARGRYNAAVQQAKGASDKIEKTNAALEAQQAKIDKITLEIGELNKEVSTEALEKAFSTAGVEGFNASMLRSKEGVEELRNKLNQLDEQRLTDLKNALGDIGLGADKAEEYVEQLRGTLGGVRESADDIKRSASEMENLKNQVLQFFSLTNSVQLFRRAVTKAMNTVKELDATMTEAAVVTEFDVGDMWDKLPQYSAEAQKLGVSINGMYQATTLYYQQGLKTNEAMQLGVETMKMAKIAGIDSTEATKAMTAALRGFNMELNELSATKVNDVYSQLAAVTAADTSQIATAMEKTASIAASANMEFETTAALLAQIIETTQEAPETAGTAMKTIIARFSEVKSLKDSGKTSGTDSEGEELDVNKIQTALRTVGISMEGFFNGTEGLDSILLKLAGKWDTLDFETQHYIATMAAGSRQQSRFIAMMSDYGRTTELVGEAQNSAGASQKQFEKTQDSLAAKLQRLSNAWDQFLMGLSNNEIIKGVVDFLTFVIEGVNKLTDALSGGNGLTKSLVSLITVIGSLKLARGALSKVMGSGLNWAGQQMGLQPQSNPNEQSQNGMVGKMVPNPTQEGQQAGQKAGQGFIAGFKNAIAAKGKGESPLKAFFTTGENKQIIDGKFKGGTKPLTKKGQQQRAENQKSVDLEKDSFMKSAMSKNTGLDDASIDKVSQAYDDIIAKGGNAKQAAEGANSALKEMGGEMGEIGANAENVSLGLQGATLNMGALGGAAMTAGGLFMGLSSIFESMGLDGLASAVGTLGTVFMSLGSVMSILSSIAPMLGMSFTTAGIQITTAGVTSQLAWWWVFLIIAAVAALIALFVGLAKAAKKASLEGRMKAAAEATENAKNAAKEAKQAYDDLLSSKSEYDETQEKLSELTKGTQEWKEALVEANNQVLSLLSTYPQLAQYLQQGEFGQLVISDEGWDSLIKQQQQAVRNSSAAVTASQMEETRLQQEKNETNLKNEAYNAGIMKTTDDGYSYTDEAAVQDIYKAYKQQGAELFRVDSNGQYSDALQALASETGYTAEQIYKMKDALGEYDAALVKNETQLQGQARAMLATGVSSDFLGYEYSEQLLDGLSAGVATIQNQKEKEVANKVYSSDGKSESKNNDYFKSLAKEYGLDSNSFTGKDAEDLEILYAKMAGISRDQIAEGLKGNKEELAKEIAKMQAAKESSEEAERVYKAMKGLSKENQRIYSAAMGKDVSNIGRKDLNTYNNLNTQEMATKLGYGSESDLAKALGYIDAEGNADIAAMKAEMQSLGQQAVAEFDKISQRAIQLGLEEEQLNKDYLSNATTSQFSAYTDLMAQALGVGGKEGAEAFQNSFDAIMAAASPEQKDQILNMLDSFDFTQEGSAAQFMDFLSQIGVMLPTEQAATFTKQLNDLSTSFKNIDISGLRDQIKDLLDLGDSIGERSSSEGLTQEEYDMIIESGVASKEDFAWTGQEWVYLKGPMGELQKAIESNTTAILNQTKRELEDQIEKGEKVAEVDKKYGETVQYTAYNPETGGLIYGGFSKEDFLAGNVTDETGLREIFGLDRDMSKAEVLEYYKSAIASYGKLSSNKEALAQLNTQDEFMVNTNTNTKDIDVNTESGQKQLKALARVYDVAQGTIDQFENALKNGTDEEKRAAAAALKNAVEQKKQEQQYGKTLKKLEETNKQYSQTTKGMQGYAEAINSYGDALGLDMTDIDNLAFVEENLGLIRKAAEGDIDSILTLNRLLAEEHGLTITADGNFDLYNFNLQEAGKETEEFIKKQYEAGAFEVVEVKVDQAMTYLEPIFDENGAMIGVEQKTAEAGSTISMLQPQDKSSLIRSQTLSGSSSSGSSESSEWKNPYDEHYNSVAKINTELRKREKLELRYQRLLNRNAATAKKLSQVKYDQLASYSSEREQREALLANRKEQMTDIESEYSDVGKYAWYDEAMGQVQIDWSNLEALENSDDEELQERVEEYISKLEEQQGLIQDEEDAIDEINDGVWAIFEEGKDEYFDLEDQIKEALVNSYQDEIDKLSEINETINETNSDLLDSMQEQIDEYRQTRDNQETEDKIADKQRKLAYLQMDTSGANATEILKLQEEIDEAQEDYTDKLIDQKISDLQDQNDAAAEQRERQIEIAQAQLDQYVDSGAIWDEVYSLMETGLDPDTGLVTGSQLETLLKTDAAFEGMSKLGQMEWLNSLNTNVASALSWLTSGATQSIFGEGNSVTFKDKNGNTVTGTVNKEGNVEVTDENGNKTLYSAESFSMDYKGNVTSSETGTAITSSTPTSTSDWPSNLTKPSEYDKTVKRNDKGDAVKAVQTALDMLDYDIGSSGVDGSFGPATEKAVKNFQKDQGIDQDGRVGPNTREKFKVKGYSTGGLADFTGPAWLDGTKSKPEYILNADQTKAFFTLVDVLSSLQSSTSKSAEKTGDNSFDIDINVESIGSDYDVEQLADKIKRLINEDARYRNNNTTGLMR